MESSIPFEIVLHNVTLDLYRILYFSLLNSEVSDVPLLLPSQRMEPHPSYALTYNLILEEHGVLPMLTFPPTN